MCILDFFNMKTLLKLLLAQKLISSMRVLFKTNLLPSDTVPLKSHLITTCLHVQILVKKMDARTEKHFQRN